MKDRRRRLERAPVRHADREKSIRRWARFYRAFFGLGIDDVMTPAKIGRAKKQDLPSCYANANSMRGLGPF